jgi:hypothetical protein
MSIPTATQTARLAACDFTGSLMADKEEPGCTFLVERHASQAVVLGRWQHGSGCLVEELVTDLEFVAFAS